MPPIRPRSKSRTKSARPGSRSIPCYQLIRLNFDLVTGFSIVPLQMYSILGFLVSLLPLGFFGLILYRRIVYGPEAEGLFTLFAIAFLLLGVALFGIGLLGEYVGRIYQQVRERPRYLIQAILEAATRPRGAARKTMAGASPALPRCLRLDSR